MPEFDIARGRSVDGTQAFELSIGQNDTVKRCVADEQQALTQLQTQWSQFLARTNRNAPRKPTLAARRIMSTS
ncbi:hypothetical protein [Bradyrhizobium sp.]|uniref:hypothetical protein n=1 Tax=Bradyrhizobium sp. TaxID=376 RepID=UPI003C5770BE